MHINTLLKQYLDLNHDKTKILIYIIIIIIVVVATQKTIQIITVTCLSWQCQRCVSLRSTDMVMNDKRFLFVLDVIVLHLLDELKHVFII